MSLPLLNLPDSGLFSSVNGSTFAFIIQTCISSFFHLRFKHGTNVHFWCLFIVSFGPYYRICPLGFLLPPLTTVTFNLNHKKYSSYFSLPGLPHKIPRRWLNQQFFPHSSGSLNFSIAVLEVWFLLRVLPLACRGRLSWYPHVVSPCAWHLQWLSASIVLCLKGHLSDWIKGHSDGLIWA